MYDFFLKLFDALIKNNTVLASVIIGVLSLYLLGFDAEHLCQSPYAVVALLFFILLSIVTMFIYFSQRLNNISDSVEKSEDLLDDMDHVLSAFNTFVDLLNSVLQTIRKIDADMFDLKTVIQGIPNKKLLRTLLELRSKAIVFQILEASITHAVSNDSTTSLTKERFKIDLAHIRDAFLKDVADFCKRDVPSDVKKKIFDKLDDTFDVVCNLTDNTMSINEKIYTMEVELNKLEKQLMFIFTCYLENMPNTPTIHMQNKEGE